MKLFPENITIRTVFNFRGSISLRIVLVAVSLCFIAGSLFFIIENQNKKSKIDHRKAVELSDYGFQMIMEKESEQLRADPSKINAIKRTKYNDGWYQVSVVTTFIDSLCHVDIESKGMSGSQTVVQKKKISLMKKTEGNNTMWILSMSQ